MILATIGFTQSTAERFFSRLSDNGVRRVIDVRLNNTSQLAGFAKAGDLAFFLKSICGIDYRHEPLLAPTAGILAAYKKRGITWDSYEKSFLDLLTTRQIETNLQPQLFDGSCLLCSEAKPHHCHRRLVAEYLSRRWNMPIQIKHL